MVGQSACSYNHTYIDIRTGIARDYLCPRPLHGGGRHCIFHTPTSTCDDEIRQAFVDELEHEFGQREGGPILFIGCTIPSIEVGDLSTERDVYFTEARFLGDVEISDVTCGAVDFTDAQFDGRLAVVAATADILRLRKVRFGPVGSNPVIRDDGGRATFELGRCTFESCDVALASAPSVRLSECDLGNATFRKSKVDVLYIHGSTFGDSADFSACTFGASQFDTVTFGGTTTFEDSSFKRTARFTQTHFRQQEMVRFCRTMSNVSFLNTNMTKIRFDADTVWNDDGSYAVLDERELVGDLSASSLSDTLAVYRGLRECHEYWLMYEEAGQFYVREMDMRRRYRDASGGGVGRRKVGRYVSLANGYNVLCRYGESFGRASAWVASVFAAATVYYYLCTDHGASGAQADMLSRPAAALERTLAAFLHAGRGGIDDHLVRVASLPTLGSMFIVLKRRLERRFRH